MAGQMERIFPLGQKSIEMRNSLTDGCATGPAARDREACLAHYLGVLRGLDEFAAGVSWQVDTFPVTRQTYSAFDAVKQHYWRSCDDDQPEEDCGWRQIIVRHIYGINTPGGVALMDCRGDNRLQQHNRACHAAITHIRKVVAEALEERVNCFLCELVEEVKEKRRNNMQRLADQEEAAGGGVSILKQLADDLGARSADSQCSKIRKRCQNVDGGISDGGT
jgi:hypothetical protein